MRVKGLSGGGRSWVGEGVLECVWLVGVRAAEEMRLRRVCDRVPWGAGEAGSYMCAQGGEWVRAVTRQGCACHRQAECVWRKV